MPTPTETSTGARAGLGPPHDHRMAVTRHRLQPGTLLLRVSGEVDLGTAPRLGHELADAARSLAPAEPDIDTPHPPQMLCDLSGVTFLGAAGLGALLETDHLARTHGVGLRLVLGSRRVRRVLAVSGLDHHLDTCERSLDPAPPRGTATASPAVGPR